MNLYVSSLEYGEFFLVIQHIRFPMRQRMPCMLDCRRVGIVANPQDGIQMIKLFIQRQHSTGLRWLRRRQIPSRRIDVVVQPNRTLMVAPFQLEHACPFRHIFTIGSTRIRSINVFFLRQLAIPMRPFLPKTCHERLLSNQRTQSFIAKMLLDVSDNVLFSLISFHVPI